MARTVDLSEEQRKLLVRLVHDEWRRLDEIRGRRYLNDDPILKEQFEVEQLEAKLR